MRYLDVITHHNTQIVSTADLKTHLRITFTDDDSYIDALEKAAVHRIEEYTNRLLLDSVCIQYGNTFADLNIIYKSPMTVDVPVVEYLSSGSWTTLATGDREIVDKIEPPRCYLMPDATLPDADDVFQAWRIQYTVGYGSSASDVPEPLVQAIKIMVADMYENRQSVIVGKIVSEIPKTAEYLMMPYKVQIL